MENSVENTPEKQMETSSKDIIYVFTLILVLVACFDFLGNIMRFFISYAIVYDLIQVTEANANQIEPILNLILNLGAQMGAILGFTILYRKKKIEPEVKTTPKGPKSHFPLITYLLHAINIFLIFIFITPLDFLLDEGGLTTDSPYEAINPTSVTINDPVFLILFFTVLAIGAPIWEELVFRRTLIPLFERRGVGQMWALIFSSLMFSLQHTPTDLYDGSVGFAMEHFLGTLFGGLLLGFLYLRTRNILWPILFHAGTNSFGLIGQFSDIDLPDVGSPLITLFMMYWIFIALAVGAGISIYLLVKYFQEKDEESKPIWMQIITETKDKSGALLKFCFFLAIFIAITGIVPISLDLFREFLNPNTDTEILFFYFIQIIVVGVLIIIYGLFVFKTDPISEPNFVSTKVHEFETQRSFRRPDFVPTVISESSQRCVSCGNLVLPNAKFCAFCGSDLVDQTKGSENRDRF